MRKKFTLLFVSLFLMFYPLFLINIFADQPPDPGGGPGGGDPVGGGSPVGGGLIYLLVMVGIYGFNKLRLLVKSDKH